MNCLRKLRQRCCTLFLKREEENLENEQSSSSDKPEMTLIIPVEDEGRTLSDGVTEIVINEDENRVGEVEEESRVEEEQMNVETAELPPEEQAKAKRKFVFCNNYSTITPIISRNFHCVDMF